MVIPEEKILRTVIDILSRTSGTSSTLSPNERLSAMTSTSLRPMRWEAIYAQAWAPEPGTPMRDGLGELAQVPLSRIPIRRRKG